MVYEKEALKPLYTAGGRRGSKLLPSEAEVIEVFVRLGLLLGIPPSVAKIYGLLFISPTPLALDDVIERLQVSQGSASMGLTHLKNLNAIRVTPVPNSRRIHYSPVAELRKLAGNYLKLQVQPALEDCDRRLRDVEQDLDSLSEEQRTHLRRRLKTLSTWDKNTRRMLPGIVKMLGG